jgi:hypothetical protein
MNKWAIIFLLAAPNFAKAELQTVDTSKTVDNYYQFEIIVIKNFTVSKVTAALTVFSKPMMLVIRCDGNELGSVSKKYTNHQLNVDQTMTATAEIDANSCPSNSFDVYFETPGLEISELPASVKVRRGKLSIDGFIRYTNDQFAVNAEDLISYSGLMSQQAASEPTLSCIIESYSKRPGFSGIIQELKTNFFNTFGTEYSTGKFMCPPTNSLQDLILGCKSTPTERSPFCNSVKLYDFSKYWFVDSYMEAKTRRTALTDDQTETNKRLRELEEMLKQEIDNSDTILGIETGTED